MEWISSLNFSLKLGHIFLPSFKNSDFKNKNSSIYPFILILGSDKHTIYGDWRIGLSFYVIVK